MKNTARPPATTKHIQMIHRKFGRQMLVRSSLLGVRRWYMCASVPFAGNVDRMEGRFYCCRCVVTFGFCMGPLKLLHTACASQFLTVFVLPGVVFQTKRRVWTHPLPCSRACAYFVRQTAIRYVHGPKECCLDSAAPTCRDLLFLPFKTTETLAKSCAKLVWLSDCSKVCNRSRTQAAIGPQKVRQP